MNVSINFFLAVFVVVFFAFIIKQFNLFLRIKSLKKISKQLIQVFKDSTKSDREKEQVFQRQSRKLFKILMVFVGINILAITCPLVVVWGLEQIGVGSLSNTLAVLSQFYFLLGVIILSLLIYLIIRRFKKL